ncbi:MAG: hypothetical protein HY518_04520 [Candidatus Aenigmarchaeota archaeon]|nr:hypothetical protein [Candidatus Aenigmarchaeota archaeon]
MPWKRRRGVTQLDWAISLGIFLLYLAWFFLLVRPLMVPQEDGESLLRLVEKGLEENYTWSLSVLPLFVRSNITDGNAAIAAEFSSDWQPQNTYLGNLSFFLDDGTLFFVAPLQNGTSLFQAVHSSERYSAANITPDIASTSTEATVNSKAFTLRLRDSIPEIVKHNGRNAVSGFNLSILGERVPVNSTFYNSTSAVVKYKAVTPLFNHSTYLFSYNALLYAAVQSTQTVNLTLTFVTANYTNYYTLSGSGLINATNSSCSSIETGFLDLYDSFDGVAFFTPNSTVSLCANRSGGVEVRITFSSINKTVYRMLLHPGGFQNITPYLAPYATVQGTTMNLSGVSLDRILALNQTGYSQLRSRFGFPSERDFAFYVGWPNGTREHWFVPVSAGATDVYSKEARIQLLDRYGNLTPRVLSIRVW